MAHHSTPRLVWPTILAVPSPLPIAVKQSRTFWFWLFMALAVLVSLLALRGKVAWAHEPGVGRPGSSASRVDSTI